MEKPRGNPWARLRARLVDDWRMAWRWWSVRAAAVLGLLATALFAAPETLVSVIHSLPPELRGWLPPLAGPLLTAAIVLIRLWKQGEPK